MQLRTAAAEDLARLAPLASEFYSASKFLKRFDLDRFVTLWTTLFATGGGVIFILAEKDGSIAGTIGGVAYPEVYSGDMIANEMFWYVHASQRGGGMRLYRAFEQWARDLGCVAINMVHLEDSMPAKLATVYRRLGFTLMERHYQKTL